MNDGCTGPLKVSRLLPFSTRTRSTQRRRRNCSSSVSSSASLCSRRPSSGEQPVASTAARASSAEANRSLISRSSDDRDMLNSSAGYRHRPVGSRPLYRDRAGGGAPDDMTDRDVHRETLDSERRKAPISEQRHLENAHVRQDRHGVDPFRAGPVIPEFPQETADESGQQQVDQASVPPVPQVAQDRFGA